MKKYKLGLIAKDIKNSVTPAAYAAYAVNIGVDISYDIFNIEADALASNVAWARENWDGFTVTMPYKKSVMEFADELDESAEACGSINTMLVREGRLIGFNTDGWGFIKHLSINGVTVKDKNIVMVGAGGVALSIAYQLKIAGTPDIQVLNIYSEEGKSLCSAFGDKFHFSPLNKENLYEACKDANLFINASILGQIGYPDYDSFSFIEALTPDSIIYDVNYSKGDSELLERAKKSGHIAMNGSAMSICQGIKAFEIWAGQAPSDQVALKLIKERQEQGKNKKQGESL